MAKLSEDANFRACLNPDCASGQVHESGHEQPIMTCRVCSTKMCFTHEAFWHEGLTCRQLDENRALQREQEQASLKTISEKAKACPNKACAVRIIKRGGCDHMTCMFSKIDSSLGLLTIMQVLNADTSFAGYACALIMT